MCTCLDLRIFIFLHLYWSTIVLQWCVNFCCNTKWVSYTYTYIPISPSSCISLPPSLSGPPPQVITKHRADIPVLCSCFPLAIYFTCGSVYVSMPLSHFVPAYPSPSLCPQVHSLGLCLYSCSAPRFFRTFFRFRIYVLAYGICFSDLLHSVWQSWSIHLTANNSISFIFMAE